MRFIACMTDTNGILHVVPETKSASVELALQKALSRLLGGGIIRTPSGYVVAAYVVSISWLETIE